MSLVRTGVFLNWSSVTLSYGTGPTVVTLLGVTDCQFEKNSEQLAFYGDAKLFPAAIGNTKKSRMCTITASDIKQFDAVPEDVPVTITAVLNDFKNGAAAGGGGQTHVLVNAIRSTRKAGGSNNSFGSGSVTYNATGSTGDTDPYSVTDL